jgi:hypothetical protein
VLIGIANLSVDPLPHIRFHIARPFEGEPRIEYLTPDGKAVQIEAQVSLKERYLHLRTPVRIGALALGCFRLTRA